MSYVLTEVFDKWLLSYMPTMQYEYIYSHLTALGDWILMAKITTDQKSLQFFGSGYWSWKKGRKPKGLHRKQCFCRTK